jgi:hypothetical protein
VPRYFFHVHDSADALDEVGTVLSGPSEAREDAVVASGEMLKDYGPRFWGHPDWKMWVTDEAGKTVCILTVKAEAEQ